MKFIFTILSFLIVISLQTKLITIDLRLNNDKTYIIKNKDDNINFSFDNNSNINIIPQKFSHLIKLIFINNNLLHNCLPTKYKEYDTFYCTEKIDQAELNNIKLNFNFEKYTQTLEFSQLFSKKRNFYFFNFFSKPNITRIILGTKKIYNDNNNLRLLKSDNETQGKNDTDIITNNSEKENSNSQKSGIGWLGIFLIILLSLIVIYVVYVGFRYYRRKKYQNPSFYYKITEEMFDDITPIE